jgi:hypothetical protein
MLRAVPKGWFSSGYEVLENNAVVAVIDPSWTREAAELNIQGATYRAYREGLMSGAFLLESGSALLARAVKPSAFFRSFEVEHAGKQYTLEAESAAYRKFVLTEAGTEVGSIYPETWVTRKAIVDLPETISLPGRVFMFWLVMILWRRASEAAAT